VLHLKGLDCTKIVQNRPISTCGNGLSDLCSNGTRYAKVLKKGLREVERREKRRTDLGEELGPFR